MSYNLSTICRDAEVTGKDVLNCGATDRTAAALATPARVRIATPCVGCARAQFDSGRRHLRLRLVGCARCVQLLVRRSDRASRDCRRTSSARAARDPAQIEM